MKFTCWTFILISLLVYSCTASEKQTPANRDKLFLDSLLKQHSVDSIIMRPKVALEALSEARTQVTDSMEYYRLLRNIAKCHYVLFEFDSMKALCDQVIDFAGREKAKPHPPSMLEELTYMQADALNTSATMYAQLGNFDSTLHYLNESYSLIPLLEVGYNIAEIYYQKSDYVPALQQYRKVLFNIDSLAEGERH